MLISTLLISMGLPSSSSSSTSSCSGSTDGSKSLYVMFGGSGGNIVERGGGSVSAFGLKGRVVGLDK